MSDMSAMYASYDWLLLLIGSRCESFHRVITFQAVALLTVATCGTILIYRLPVLREFILIDGASSWLY